VSRNKRGRTRSLSGQAGYGSFLIVVILVFLFWFLNRVWWIDEHCHDILESCTNDSCVVTGPVCAPGMHTKTRCGQIDMISNSVFSVLA
jgi:hypothetical protein